MLAHELRGRDQLVATSEKANDHLHLENEALAEGEATARAALAARDGEVEGLRLAAGVREEEVAGRDEDIARLRRDAG